MVRLAHAERHPAPSRRRSRPTISGSASKSAGDTPWDQFVRAIVTATGESIEDGPTNFYALSQSPEDMTENVCQAFLGLSIGCAKCHNHPLEKWTNDQYYGMASLFARVQGQGMGRRGPLRRRPAHALRRRIGRAGPAADRQAAAPHAARRQAARLRRPGRPPRQPGEMADRAREPLLRPVDRQPRLGQLFRRRAGREGRRHAGLEPAEQRGPPDGRRRLPGQAEVRPEGPHEGDSPVERLPAVEPPADREIRPIAASIRAIIRGG